MQHDPGLIAEIRDWLIRASEDLKAAEALAGIGLAASAAFHVQQTAEKAQKAFLTVHGKLFTKTHDLRLLGAECAKIDNSLENIAKAIAPISGYAVGLRYPGSATRPTSDEVQAALALAVKIYEAILARVPPEAWP